MADVLHKDLTGAELHDPKAHKTSHQLGGSDALNVAGLSGELASLQPPKDHAHSSSGSGVGGQLGEGALSLSDVTTNDVSTTKHGFAPKAPNDVLKFLRGDATWATPGLLPQVMSYMNTMYGDGADGAVTISTDTTLSIGTGGIKVMRYTNLTINSGYYLEGNASDKVLVILVTGTLTINGTLRMNGRGAAGGSGNVGDGGDAGAAGGGGGGNTQYVWGGSYDSGGGGGGGRNGQASAGEDVPGRGGNKYNEPEGTQRIVFPFQAGCGYGGNAVANSAGENGGSYMPAIVSPLPFYIFRCLFGSGGGEGAYDAGGDGGKGGGCLWIEAQSIVWGDSGIASANGNAGSTGGNTYSGGGGGGGGGIVQVMYKSKSGSSTIQVNGGSGGAAGGGLSRAGGSGAAGVSGEFQVE